ncbi:MAG: strawberry notch C-terminal domain-containing protein [Cyanobacteria bacterium P01_F01_bin.53]
MQYQERLTAFFRKQLATNTPYASITAARKAASTVLDVPIVAGGSLVKEVDEAIEAALVRIARDIVDNADSPRTAYQQLVDLYNRQPKLGVRTSTSVLQQAYSTPLPIAYLAGNLAGIDTTTTMYEPTAGHGALLLGTSRPGLSFVNEINPDRANDLRRQGYLVTEEDAASYTIPTQVDVVLANPPFGVVKDAEINTIHFPVSLPHVPAFTTPQIDQAISLKALQAMKADGRAVLIIGGKRGRNDAHRSDKYNTAESRRFFYALYRHYRVIDHFTVAGDLYHKQGAGWPLDVIVIHGHQHQADTSAWPRRLPAADLPRIYTTFAALGDLIDDRQRAPALDTQRDGSLTAGGSVAQSPADLEQRGSLSQPTQQASGLADSDVVGGIPVLGSRDTDHAQDSPNHHQSGDISTSAATINNRSHTLDASLGNRDRRAERGDTDFAPERGSDVSSRRAEPTPAAATGADPPVSEQSRILQPGGMAGRPDVSLHPLERPAVSAQSQQKPYRPRSGGRSVNTEVPTNLRDPIDKALSRLESQVGSLDSYVCDRLQYADVPTLHHHFSAEQIDALALGIFNLERGQALILGDQTGIGKGRVVAGIMRYAVLTERIPVFVTQSPKLYGDIIRDLDDIGQKGFKPFVTNSTLPAMRLPDGRSLHVPDAQLHLREMQQIQETGDLGQYQGIFTTYSQLQTVKKKETPRREFLRAMASSSIFIFDESHEAGGSPSDRKPGLSNRADYVRNLQQDAQGVLYSSATYAKSPYTMSLYRRTSMMQALKNDAALSSLMIRGGVPLQQTVSGMIAQDGQYIRRERSFTGVTFNPEVLPVDTQVAENIALVMRKIMEFDQLKQQSVKEMSKELKAEAKAVSQDNSTGDAGATSTNFTSIMHNLVQAAVLALKSEAVVQKSLSLLRQENPEKPVIALSNTMGSFISQYAKDNGLSAGEPIDANFGDMLLRYLSRSRDVTIGSAFGPKQTRRLTDTELTPEAVDAYAAVQDLIQSMDFSQIPVSPIDYMTERLEAEGYRVKEITGRKDKIVTDASGRKIYKTRASREVNESAKIKATTAFNNGQADVMILNRSGATGISLHASERFADQTPRHMIVAQPELNINLMVQTYGRIHRTGQVALPRYTLLMADIPAEKRPGAVLMKKMASLNANTTAARSSGMSLDAVPDIFNDYGDLVISEVMEQNPLIHAQLDYPLSSDGDSLQKDNAVARVTGRLPILRLADQEKVWGMIEAEYAEVLERAEAQGENKLEASQLDLDARLIARMELEAADGDSPFTGAVTMQVMDVKVLRKPYTGLEAVNLCREMLEMGKVKTMDDAPFASLFASAPAVAKQLADNLDMDYQAYFQHLERTAEEKVVKHVDALATAQLPKLKQLLTDYPIGTPVRLIAPGTGETFYGFVNRVWRRGDHSTNPAAASQWRMKLLLADGRRELTLPLSKINGGESSFALMTESDSAWVTSMFDIKRQKARETRQILTGNILRAFERYDKSRVINFTDCHGQIHTGLLLKAEEDLTRSLADEPVKIPTVAMARQILEQNLTGGTLTTRDGHLHLGPTEEGYVLQTPGAKQFGGRYFLNMGLLKALEGDFVSVADRMQTTFTPDKLDAVLTAIIEDNHWPLCALENLEAVRKLLGVKLPELEMLDEPFPVKSAPVVAPVVTPAPPNVVPPPQVTTDKAVKPQIPVKSDAEVKPAPRPSVQRKKLETPESKLNRFLEEAGIAKAALSQDTDNFYVVIDNPPYIPLVIERHDDTLHVLHYQKDAANELYIETEAVFMVEANNTLQLLETASNAGFGEIRNCDRSFANLFMNNIYDQGFAKACQVQCGQQQSISEPEAAVTGDQGTLFDLESAATAPASDAPEASDPAWRETPPQVPAITVVQQAMDNVDPQTGNILAAAPVPIDSTSTTLVKLRQWYRAARDLQADDLKLDSIKILGLSVRQAADQQVFHALSDDITREMQETLEQYKPYQERSKAVAAIAKQILEKVGTRNEQGDMIFTGRTYHIESAGTTLTIKKASIQGFEPIVIKKHNSIAMATAEAIDIQAFEAFAGMLKSYQIKAKGLTR